MAEDKYIGKKFGKLTPVKRFSQYKSGHTYYLCECECGNQFMASQSNLYRGKATHCGCSKPPSGKRKDHTGERYGKLIVEEMLYHYGGKNVTYARCKCDCGNETIANITNIIKGATRSCGCLERESRYGRQNHEKDISGKRFGHLTVIEKTDKRATNCSVIWRCRCDCGSVVEVSASHLLRGHTRSCGCNKISKYEELVQGILDQLGEPYRREYEFDDCKNVNRLKFDFYLPNRNACIECQGQQHYQPVDFFGGDERHKTVVRNDRIKKEYCEANNIVLVCLPYTLTKQAVTEQINAILFPRND